VIQWRAAAVGRVIAALRRLVPISHVIIGGTGAMPPVTGLSPAERRQQLIEAYGVPGPQGTPVAACAYCLTTRGAIQVDHILPRGRGGTDSWENLALACARCNSSKGERTPEEAKMPLLLRASAEPPRPRRAAPYAGQTVTLLKRHLRSQGLHVGEPDALPLPPALRLEVVLALEAPGRSQPTIVAKPVSRGRKQRYTARLYPLDTPLGPGMRRRGDAVRRLAVVNSALVLGANLGRALVEVLPADTAQKGRVGERTVVRRGALCSAVRAGRTVMGIVDTIHSVGRLTLQVLDGARGDRVRWRRVVVSPRQSLRVLSRDGVIFLWPAG
jgi:hypothetical protein